MFDSVSVVCILTSLCHAHEEKFDSAVSCTHRGVRLHGSGPPRISTPRCHTYTEEFDSAVSGPSRRSPARCHAFTEKIDSAVVRSIAVIDSAVSCIHREDRLRYVGTTAQFLIQIQLFWRNLNVFEYSLYSLSGARVGLIDEK